MHTLKKLPQRAFKYARQLIRSISDLNPRKYVNPREHVPLDQRGLNVGSEIIIPNYYLSLSKYIIGLLVFIGLASCGSGNGDSPVINLPASISDPVIEISQDQYDMGAMDTGRYVFRSFEKLIRTTGVLDVPPEGRAQVSAYFDGYVKSLNLIPGQRVRRGQTLFTLENPAYIEVQQNYLEVKNSLDYLRREYERQDELVKDNFTSEKNYLKAESDYRVNVSRYQSLRKRLEMMRINPDKLTDTSIQTTINIQAPISGYVTGVNASTGMFLSPGDIAVTLLNTNHIHIELSVYESDLPRISIGQKVRFKVQSDPFNWYDADVYLINRVINESNRTVMIHCHLEDESLARELTPGMFVEAEIVTKQDSLPALPEEAVVALENKSYVLVWEGNDNGTSAFERQEVNVGPLFNGYYPLQNADDFTPETIFLVRGGFGLITE